MNIDKKIAVEQARAALKVYSDELAKKQASYKRLSGKVDDSPAQVQLETKLGNLYLEVAVARASYHKAVMSFRKDEEQEKAVFKVAAKM